ncbi:hypothetical protein JXA12_03260 [Candidatus Woesearchaeota archaeon]|nr:hypothetical protein [Candidatus Woesearchaeota archaeon]
MAVLRLTSKKTLPLLLEALKSIAFTQTALAEKTGTSIGRVNKVITWLKEKDIASKEAGKYIITQPNRLADLIAAQQVITTTRTYKVAADQATLERAAEQHDITFCLGTALNKYDKDRQAQSIAIIDNEQTRTYLDTLPRGEQHITLHHYDTEVSAGKDRSTDAVRTVIDLKSVGRGYEAEQLAMRLWRTRQ